MRHSSIDTTPSHLWFYIQGLKHPGPRSPVDTAENSACKWACAAKIHVIQGLVIKSPGDSIPP